MIRDFDDKTPLFTDRYIFLGKYSMVQLFFILQPNQYEASKQYIQDIISSFHFN